MAYKNPNDQKKYAKEHYKANKPAYIKRAAKFKKKAISRNREFVLERLMSSKCADCGETDPVVLEFDHRKSEIKLGNVANLVQNGVSLSKLEIEVNKCEIRCANCHRRKTAVEENWWIIHKSTRCGAAR